MRLLLDTHALVWWLVEPSRLSVAAHSGILDQDNEIIVSAAAVWEIATKYRIGRLPEAEAFASDIAGSIVDQGFEQLSITVDDAASAGALPGPLKDPFDRILIAQALSRQLLVVSIETLFDEYGVHRLWSGNEGSD